MGWGIGTVRRPARRLSRARYTHHDGGTGGRMKSERQQSWSALKRRNPAFAAPFLKCYFIWTVSALLRSFLRRGHIGARWRGRCKGNGVPASSLPKPSADC